MKRILFFSMLIPAFLLGSCIYDKETDGVDPHNGKMLTLKIAVKQSGLQVATRSTVDSEPGEDNIASLYLLFFRPNGGQFIDYVEIDNAVENTSTVIDISTHPSLGVGDAYDILAVANIGDNYYVNDATDTWMQRWSGHTMEEVKAEAAAWVEESGDNTPVITPDKLLMTGTITKAQDQFDLELELTRNVVRFDVLNNTEQDYDLVSAALWNVYPSSVIWGTKTTKVDFSSSIARISHFYGIDNSENVTDTDGADGKGKTLANIKGRLYCFENQVVSPSQNDHLTTCLIVGLKKRASGTTGYYRVNINPNESPQVLNENNVYILNINSVISAGSASAADAYAAAESGLDYKINYWDMGNYGVIVQDGNSILSIPNKTITFDKKGGTLVSQIFTFNNSGSTSTLKIKEQSYTPADGSITATLNGSKLSVTATPLGTTKERTGSIVLTYAGLEATVYVVQENATGVFLQVHQSSETIRPLAPYAGIATEDFGVEASGPWTVELFMPIGGFTLDPAALSPTKAVTKIRSIDPLVVDDQFKVYTWSANPDPTKRDCFAVVTLDSDPENYAAVIRLAQSPTGGISIVPNVTSVTFNGMGTGLASISGNTTATFNVRPSMEDDGSGGERIAQWEQQVIASGSNNDIDKFVVLNEGHSQSDASVNTITVGAVGPNLSGRPYTATLKLSLSQDVNTYMLLTLVQQPLTITLSPGTIPAVSTDGGTTRTINVVSDASLKWKAAIVTNSGTSADGRSLVHHEATLVDQNGNPIVPGTEYPMNTQICVRFPKVYYPNRDISISATLTVTVEGMTTKMTVNQTTLTAKTMDAYGMTGAPDYGALGDVYNRGWDGTSGTYGLAQIPGYSVVGTGNMNVTTIPSNVDYLHVVAHISGTNGTNYSWSVINNFIDTRDAWTVIAAQDNYGLGPMNNPNSPTKRNGAGYKDMVYSISSRNAQIFQDRTTPSKLYQFVMDKGHTPLAPANIDNGGFYNDGVSCTIPGPWPPTAVVLMTKINDTTQASLIVDIKNKFLWLGDSQIFWNNTYLTNNRGTFLDNLMYFIANASKYGSNFTDLLLEDTQDGAQPAPWDTSYWGPNAGVPSK